MNDFLNIPPYIWKDIFPILKVLGVGLLLAFFAAKYQKRKEIEIKIKGEVLKLRLRAYVKINVMLSEIQHLIAPSLYKQGEYIKMLDGFDFLFKYVEYTSFFNSEETFDDYYCRLQNLLNEEHIYLEYEIEQKLLEMINYFSEIKMMLDAFCDTEHSDGWKLSEKVVNDHIQMAYQTTGVALQNDMNRFYCQMDKLIAKQMRNISLSYKDAYLKRWHDYVHKFFAKNLEPYIEDKGCWGKVSQFFYFRILFPSYGNSLLIKNIPRLITALMFIHYSNEYTRDEFDKLNEDDIQKKIQMFYSIYMLNYHHD